MKLKFLWRNRAKFEPTDETTLEDYLEWFVEFGTSVPQLPSVDGCDFNGESPCIVLHRSGQFQTQMFLTKPNLNVPTHAHPNVNIYALHVGGDVDLIVDDSHVVPIDHINDERDGIFRFWGNRVHVPAGCKHSLDVGPNGGVFITVQHWLNNIKPNSIDFDWYGPAMDKRHAQVIGVDFTKSRLCA